MKQHLIGFMTSLFLLTLILGSARPVHAASAVVGNGTAASCTEAAFDSALSAADSGGGTITFNCGAAVKTIPFTSSKNILNGNVTIDGNNLIILAGGPGVRHFFINDGLTFTLRNITLRDGDSAVGGGSIEASGAQIILESVQLLNNYAPNQGGAIYCYVGIGGTLTINNSLFEHNASNNGGAIYNDGCETTITNTTFKTNQADSAGGAIHNAFSASLQVDHSQFQGNSALDGGGLFNDSGSTVTLNSVTFQSNTGGHGGGLENSGAVTLNDSLIDSNIVTGSGGGIWNLNGTAIMNRSTVSNNSAYEGGGINTYGAQLEITDANIINNVTTGAHGGGIYHGGGTAFIINATISGNHAAGVSANGGGIYQNSDDNLTLTNVTLANNRAGALGGGLYHYGRYAILTNVTMGDNVAVSAGDAIYEDSPMTVSNPGVVQLWNSVIFGSANNCDGGIFDSMGHNISQGACSVLTQPTDQDNYGGSLNLGALAFNGGAYPMQTIMPLAGSPLIDAGDTCSAADQRGGARPVGAACDVGTVEYGAVVYHLFLPLILR
jgi:predicted outer membrane repeat protein